MPETISEARTRLPAHARRFREQGLDADPVVLGDRRHPDAVLLPYETFKLLLDVAEDVAIEDRTDDLPYLLAGLRLGRLEDPVRRSDAQRQTTRGPHPTLA